MDDNQFDDIIKGKVGEYQEPGFDPAALADLHYRMAASNVAWPWYSRYRTELFVGASLVICTLIILWSQWSLSGSEMALLNNNLTASKKHDEIISKLQNEINYLRAIQPDTIRLTDFREQNSTQYTTLLNRIANLEALLENFRSPSIPIEEFSVLDSEQSSYNVENLSNRYPYRLTPRHWDIKSVRAPWKEKSTNVESKARSLSVKAIRDIEDHYQKGIGIRVGPTLEISKGIYSIGSGSIDIAGGFLADFILLPSLSIETGGKYAHRVHQISDQADIAEKTFPEVEEGLGTPKNVDIDSWILEIPFNLKYRYPLSLKTHWLTSVGYSSMLFTKQVLEYDYALSGNPSASIYSTYTNQKPEFYSGALNISLGLSNETKKKNIFETSLFYQHGLAGAGVENIQRSHFGVRSVYWFRIR